MLDCWDQERTGKHQSSTQTAAASKRKPQSLIAELRPGLASAEDRKTDGVMLPPQLREMYPRSRAQRGQPRPISREQQAERYPPAAFALSISLAYKKCCCVDFLILDGPARGIDVVAHASRLVETAPMILALLFLRAGRTGRRG